MSKRSRNQRGRAKATVFMLALVLGLAAVAYAIAETIRSPGPAKQNEGLATSSAGGLSIRVKPLTRSVAPGEVASFTVRIRGANRRMVRLSVRGDLPQGATALFSPRSTRRSKASLMINTGNARSGGHRIRLLARRGKRRATAAANLVITAKEGDNEKGGNANFTISGDLPGLLVPGATQPLDLALTNPGTSEISISQLVVSIGGIDAPLADGTHPCTLDDFSIEQFTGAYGFKLAPSDTSTLSELGFPAEDLPSVTMLDRPVNQDGCKGASLSFSYSGSSTGGS